MALLCSPPVAALAVLSISLVFHFHCCCAASPVHTISIGELDAGQIARIIDATLAPSSIPWSADAISAELGAQLADEIVDEKALVVYNLLAQKGTDGLDESAQREMRGMEQRAKSVLAPEDSALAKIYQGLAKSVLAEIRLADWAAAVDKMHDANGLTKAVPAHVAQLWLKSKGSVVAIYYATVYKHLAHAVEQHIEDEQSFEPVKESLNNLHTAFVKKFNEAFKSFFGEIQRYGMGHEQFGKDMARLDRSNGHVDAMTGMKEIFEKWAQLAGGLPAPHKQ